ncbi:unnamed protein product [Porites lobata]|uniref:Uncharacterized protein n=1 Tax=Porites lobata TaxID=104759 RepID=A0ABN8S6Q0_9CNID|nr:unnamed protein product [Porites lobata]
MFLDANMSNEVEQKLKENFPNSKKSISKKHLSNCTGAGRGTQQSFTGTHRPMLMLIFNMKTFARVIIIVFLLTTVSSTFRAEVRGNAVIQVPEGCHWPSHYIECMMKEKKKRSPDYYDLEGICYELACT